MNTSAKTDVSYPTSLIQLADGLYNVTFIGKGHIRRTELRVEVNAGVQQNVTVSGGSCKLDLTAHVVNTKDADFVIAGNIPPGTYNEAGKQHNGDQYVRIYNNSDTVLYADGLVFMESHHHHTEISVGRPGYHERSDCGRFCGRSTGQRNRLSDTTGESFIICDNAINHKEANLNSIDLSNANFEWYIESKQDVDNPAVPNMDIYYCYTKTILDTE